MFGGLDLKDKKKEEKDSNGPPAAAAPSAFSFLSGSPAPSAPAAASSGFSFLNPAAAASATEEAAAAAPATASAFGFMTATSSTQAPAEAPAAAAASSFSFMSSPAATSNPTEEPAPAATPAAASSSFSFLSPGGSTPAAAPAVASTTSATSFAPAVGTGVSFGRAGLAAGTKKKKKRTARVGVAAHGPPELPPPPPPPAVAVTPTPPPPVLPTIQSMDSTDTVDSDDVLAAATAAAQQAQNYKPGSNHGSSNSNNKSLGLKGLFRARSNTSGSGIVDAKSSSSVGSDSMSNSTDVPPSKPPLEIPVPVKSNIFRPPVDKDPVTIPKPLVAQEPPPKAPTLAASSTPVTSLSSFGIGSASTTSSAAAPPKFSLMAKQHPKATAPSIQEKKKQATPTNRYESLMATFLQSVQDAMRHVTHLRAQRTGLQRERHAAQTRERYAQQEWNRAETALQAAAAEEDFEQADRMQSVMDGYQAERTECATLQRSIDEALEELDSQKQNTVDAVAACFGQMKQKLQDFSKEQDATDDTDSSPDSLRKFEIISKQISAEEERLEQDLKHIERDEKLVEEESQGLEKSISEQSSDFEKLRDEAKERLSETEKEIDELRKKLQAKQATAAQLRTEIAGHDEGVLKVRVKFTRQLDRVKKKLSTIQDNREEYNQEKIANENLKTEHEATVKAHSEALLAREELQDKLSKEIDLADTFESIVGTEIGIDAEEEEVDDELAQVQAEVVKCECVLSESKETLATVTGVFSALEEEVSALNTRIPQLEEEKKAAASKRDFKAAGKASKEAKEAAARLKECEENIAGDSRTSKLAAEAEVSKAEAALEEVRKVAHEKEKVSGVKSMKRLADKIGRLHATKESVCAGATPTSIRGAGAFVLDAQIKSLMMEGESYGQKYGGWEELVAEFVPTETPAAAPTTTVSTDGTDDGEVGAAAAAASETPAKPPQPEMDDATRRANMDKFRALTIKLQTVEHDIEEAAAQEDYEKAAALDDELQELIGTLASLNLSDKDMELAFSASFEEEEATAAATTQTSVDEELAVTKSDSTSGEALALPDTVSGDEQTHEDDEIGTCGPDEVTKGESTDNVGEPEASKEESIEPSSNGVEDASPTEDPVPVASDDES